MSHALAQTYTAVNEYRSRITVVILGLCAALALYYGVSIYMTVTKTVALDAARAQVTALSSSVNKLDGSYLDLSRTITPDKLAGYGLSQGKVSQFISRSASLPRVAFGHEI